MNSFILKLIIKKNNYILVKMNKNVKNIALIIFTFLFLSLVAFTFFKKGNATTTSDHKVKQADKKSEVTESETIENKPEEIITENASEADSQVNDEIPSPLNTNENNIENNTNEDNNNNEEVNKEETELDNSNPTTNSENKVNDEVLKVKASKEKRYSFLPINYI